MNKLKKEISKIESKLQKDLIKIRDMEKLSKRDRKIHKLTVIEDALRDTLATIVKYEKYSNYFAKNKKLLVSKMLDYEIMAEFDNIMTIKEEGLDKIKNSGVTIDNNIMKINTKKLYNSYINNTYSNLNIFTKTRDMLDKYEFEDMDAIDYTDWYDKDWYSIHKDGLIENLITIVDNHEDIIDILNESEYVYDFDNIKENYTDAYSNVLYVIYSDYMIDNYNGIISDIMHINLDEYHKMVSRLNNIYATIQIESYIDLSYVNRTFDNVLFDKEIGSALDLFVPNQNENKKIEYINYIKNIEEIEDVSLNIDTYLNFADYKSIEKGLVNTLNVTPISAYILNRNNDKVYHFDIKDKEKIKLDDNFIANIKLIKSSIDSL